MVGFRPESHDERAERESKEAKNAREEAVAVISIFIIFVVGWIVVLIGLCDIHSGLGLAWVGSWMLYFGYKLAKTRNW